MLGHLDPRQPQVGPLLQADVDQPGGQRRVVAAGAAVLVQPAALRVWPGVAHHLQAMQSFNAGWQAKLLAAGVALSGGQTAVVTEAAQLDRRAAARRQQPERVAPCSRGGNQALVDDRPPEVDQFTFDSRLRQADAVDDEIGRAGEGDRYRRRAAAVVVAEDELEGAAAADVEVMVAGDAIGQRQLDAAAVALADGKLADVLRPAETGDAVAAVGVAAEPDFVAPVGAVGRADAAVGHLPLDAQRLPAFRSAVSRDGDDLQVGVGTRHEVERLRQTANVVALGEVLEDFSVSVCDDEQPVAAGGPGGECDLDGTAHRLAGCQKAMLAILGNDAIIAVAEQLVGRQDRLLAPGVADAGSGAFIGDRPADGEPRRVADDLLRRADRGDRQIGPGQLRDADHLRLPVVPSIAVIDPTLGVGGDDDLIIAAAFERNREVRDCRVARSGRQTLLVDVPDKRSGRRSLNELNAVNPVAGSDRTTVLDAPFDADAVAGAGDSWCLQAGDAQVRAGDAQRGERRVVVLAVALMNGIGDIAAHQPMIVALIEPVGQADADAVGDAVLRRQSNVVTHGGDLEQAVSRATIDVDAVPPGCRSTGVADVAQRIVQRRGVAGPQRRRCGEVAGNQVRRRAQFDAQAVAAGEQIVLQAPLVSRRRFIDAAADVHLQQNEVLASEVARQRHGAAAAVAVVG